MAKKGEITPRVAQMLTMARSGMASVEIAAALGVSARAVRSVRTRYGCQAPVGSPPSVSGPLTELQSQMVLEYLTFARGCARRVLREKSKSCDLDEADYVSVAYLALIKAAQRWKGTGRFKRYVAAFIDGALKDFRRDEMRAHGWARIPGKGPQIERVLRLRGLPRSQRTGLDVEPLSGAVTFDHPFKSSVAQIQEAFGVDGRQG